VERIDCAVVGGGISGLYAAWRLSASPQPAAGNAPLSVRVFEAHTRVGGRIDTLPVGHSTAGVEMGAMRFWKTMQMVTALLDQLQIPIEEFPGQTELSCYLRGVQLRPAHFAQPANVPYRLQGAEVGQDVGALLGYALLKLAPELAGPMTPAQMDALAERPDLKYIGFWNALQSVLSSEAYQLLQSGMGERSAFSNWHAGEAVRLMAFIGASERSGPLFRPTKGFTSLIDALVAALANTSTPVQTRHRLVTVEPASGPDKGAMVLTFEISTGDEEQPTVTHEQVIARHVILALPKRALADLLLRSHASLGRLAQFERLLDSVNVFSAFKLYASYEKPWWTQGWGPAGYSVTDLPIRQVYYGVGVGGSDADNKRVLMATYADADTAAFWGPLVARGAATSGPPPANPPVLAIAEQQLKEMHSLRQLPEPEWWGCRDWGAHGGAWHSWQPGRSVPEFIQAIRQPVPDLPMFVCGEAFSRMQGWIEGALSSTEQLLQSTPFKLARPNWLSPDYDLGP
jgi:monoamine oxidase